MLKDRNKLQPESWQTINYISRTIPGLPLEDKGTDILQRTHSEIKGGGVRYEDCMPGCPTFIPNTVQAHSSSPLVA